MSEFAVWTPDVYRLVQLRHVEQLAAQRTRSARALGIGHHMNRKQNLLAWPGFGRLQKLLGVHRETIKRGVKALERAGHMRVVRVRQGRKTARTTIIPTCGQLRG